MAINFANRSFSHSLLTLGNVSSNHIHSNNAVCKIIDVNLFVYIANNQYLSNKFYRIMINTGAFKHFTADYRQFMAYTRYINYTTIDISKVSAIHV